MTAHTNLMIYFYTGWWFDFSWWLWNFNSLSVRIMRRLKIELHSKINVSAVSCINWVGCLYRRAIDSSISNQKISRKKMRRYSIHAVFYCGSRLISNHFQSIINRLTKAICRITSLQRCYFVFRSERFIDKSRKIS